MKRSAAIWLFIAGLVGTTPLSLLAAPIHDAAQKGDIATIKTLLAQGVDINSKDEKGGTALIYATVRSQKATVEFLLNSGAKTDIIVPNGGTALHVAARYGEAEIASMLLTKGAKVDARGTEGETPLHLSTKYGFLAVARLLVEHGADLNLPGSDGFTPLIFAAGKGDAPIVDYLLSKGANANAVSKSRWPPRTALGIAAWNRAFDDTKYEPVIKLLLNHGASDNWLSALPGFDPENLSPLLLKLNADGYIMSGSLPFAPARHSAVRPWKDSGAAGLSRGGTDLFVLDAPPDGNKSTPLVVIEDQVGNRTYANAVLPAFIGDGGIVYNDGVSSVGKDGPFAKLTVLWHDDGHHPISGGHIRVTRKSGAVDLITDQQGAVTDLLGHVTTNEPITVVFSSADGTSNKVELDCVIRGAIDTSVRFVVQKGN